MKISIRYDASNQEFPYRVKSSDGAWESGFRTKADAEQAKQQVQTSLKEVFTEAERKARNKRKKSKKRRRGPIISKVKTS